MLHLITPGTVWKGAGRVIEIDLGLLVAVQEEKNVIWCQDLTIERGTIGEVVGRLMRKESSGFHTGFTVEIVGEMLLWEAVNNLQRMSMPTRQFFIAVSITLE